MSLRDRIPQEHLPELHNLMKFCSHCSKPMESYDHAIGNRPADAPPTLYDPALAAEDGAQFRIWVCKPCNHREVERLT
jgi:hypothetical protein